MTNFKKAQGLLIIVFALCSQMHSASISNKLIELDVGSAGDFIIHSKGLKNSFKASGKFILFNGNKKQNISLPKPEIHTQADRVKIIYSTQNLDWQLLLTPLQKFILIETSITNKTNSDIWLEPGIELSVASSFKAEECWLGLSNIHKLENKKHSRTELKGKVEKHTSASTRPFPAVAVLGSKTAIFAGGVPFESISYSACQVNPLKNKTLLTYSIRTAILPGKKSPVKFTVGAISKEFGSKEAIVQSYYDSMPELWAPVVGQDNPYIWGAHGQYLLWWQKPDYEISRRLHIVNEWTYCPYKRSGDIAARKDLWNYQPKNKIRKRGIFLAGTKVHLDKMTHQDFIDMRRKIFHKYAKKFGLMFYNSVIGTWCEVQLAREKYPDAIIEDKSVPHYLKTWSTHHDHEVRTFPMGTSYAKIFKEDMIHLTKELDLPGFAFDCAYSGAYYRGPATKKDLPGRAWDNKGVFIDQGVAINHIADFVHNIKKTNNPADKLVVFSNGYLKGDYMMIEEQFLGVGTYKRWMPLLKYHMGPRPGCTHGHGLTLSKVITNWRDKTQKDFKKFMPKLADYIIFNQFKYGLTSTHLTFFGNPQIVYTLPEVIDMMRLGWQAEVPLKDNSNDRLVYKARYGKAHNSCFFLGNPYDTEMPLNLDISNEYLGDMNYLFIRKMRKSAHSENIIEHGITKLKTTLASRIPYLYEAVLGLKKNSSKITCNLNSKKDIDKQTYRIAFNSLSLLSTPLAVRKIRNFNLETITVDGSKIEIIEKPNGYYTKDISLKAGTVIELTYKSTIFHMSSEKLLSFGFTDNSKNVSFNIVCNGTSTEKNEAANLIQGYFKFCSKKKVINKTSPEVKIMPKATQEGNNIIFLNASSPTPNIPYGISMPDGKTIIIKAEKNAQLQNLTKKLEYVMDEKFEYCFPFRSVMGLYGNQLTHFKMHGKHLPYKKYFTSNDKGSF